MAGARFSRSPFSLENSMYSPKPYINISLLSNLNYHNYHNFCNRFSVIISFVSPRLMSPFSLVSMYPLQPCNNIPLLSSQSHYREKNIRMTLVCTFFSGIINSTLLDMIVSRSNPQLNSKSEQPKLFHLF